MFALPLIGDGFSRSVYVSVSDVTEHHSVDFKGSNRDRSWIFIYQVCGVVNFFVVIRYFKTDCFERTLKFNLFRISTTIFVYEFPLSKRI